MAFVSELKEARVKSSFVEALWRRLSEYLGLSEYEAKLYVSLIEVGQATARKLSVFSGVPRTKVYPVLKRLIDMGFVTEIPGEPKRFLPVPPNIALKSYLQTYRNITQNLLSLISALEDALKRARTQEKLRQGSMWTINGKQSIFKKMREMLINAKRSVYIITNGNSLILLSRMFSRLLDELASRSVKIKIITTNEQNSKYLVKELKYLYDVKVFDFQFPLIVLYVDHEQLLMSYIQSKSNSLKYKDEAVFSNNPVLRRLIWAYIVNLQLKLTSAGG
ncbi:TrmB family transcriptional regulator [Candidatus Bathyarchaeota archaeon]|nr:TrmB family transcriptional regulator [Candidatus Bathyarchaeota archaeon]